MPRYNAMLAVLRNTLYVLVSFRTLRSCCWYNMILYSYGGIFELGSREYTLDDFHYIQLDKLERFVCLKPSGIVIPTEAEESSDEDGDEDDSEGSDDEESEEGEEEIEEIPTQAVERETKRKGRKGKRREDEEEQEVESVKPEDPVDEVRIYISPMILMLRCAATGRPTRPSDSIYGCICEGIYQICRGYHQHTCAWGNCSYVLRTLS
jgi:hypothetical protein